MARESLDTAKEKLDKESKEKLEKISKVLSFAASQGLSVGSSYQSFVKVEGESLSYLVQASKPDRFKSVTWWFPIVGRVPYLGFFDEEERDEFANRLREEGHDVATSDVDAFSSLGWFADPVYSTMLRRGEIDLAHLLFHELTHQTLWVKGSVEFNENLAEFIAEKITTLYIKSIPDEGERGKALMFYQDRRDDLQKFQIWLRSLRAELSDLYESKMSTEVILRTKARIIESFRSERRPKFKRYDFVGSRVWNNASILGAALYNPDRATFERALSCLYPQTAANFFQKLRREVTAETDPFKALDNMCKGD